MGGLSTVVDHATPRPDRVLAGQFLKSLSPVPTFKRNPVPIRVAAFALGQVTHQVHLVTERLQPQHISQAVVPDPDPAQ